jgi:hypothetical protein
MKRKKIPMVEFGSFAVPYELREGIRQIAKNNELHSSDIAREAFEMRIEFEKMTKKKRR